MKKMFISLMIFMWAGFTHAQFTELKEARVGFDPQLPEVTVDGNSYIFKIDEKYGREFENDPVAFLEKHCQIAAFIDLVQDGKSVEYQVDVKSTKGKMKAKYCKEGNLLLVSYKLKNVLLPPNLQEEVYRNYKGWKMTSNIRVAKGRRGKALEEYYQIRLEKGDEVQKVKLDVDELKIEVAGI